jgi:hypothetical protein
MLVCPHIRAHTEAATVDDVTLTIHMPHFRPVKDIILESVTILANPIADLAG